MASPQGLDDRRGRETALGAEDERVVQDIGDLADEGRARARDPGGLGKRVVLGSQRDLDSLLGHLAGHSVDATVEKAARI